MKHNFLNRFAAFICAVLIALSAVSCRKIEEDGLVTDIDSTVFISETSDDYSTKSPETTVITKETDTAPSDNSLETETDSPETIFDETKVKETQIVLTPPDTSSYSPTEPEPNANRIPDKYKNHIFVQAKNIGQCYELKGNILVTFVFLNDSVSSWDADSQSKAKSALDTELSEIKNDAAGYGVKLSISTTYKNASVNLDTGMGSSTDTWKKTALAAAGLPELNQLNKDIIKANSKTNIDEAPVVFLLNKNGRAFAHINEIVDYGEYIVLFNDMHALRHEFYHVFGAYDYYCPKEIADITKKHFGNCIMLDCREGGVDSLSAFIMGWTDTLDSAAISFLNDTSRFTSEYIDKAKIEDSFTGYGTKAFNLGTYTGDLVDGYQHGHGKFVYNRGDVYEGDYVFGKKEGYGTYTWTDGSYYTGQWLDDEMTGKGTESYSDGSVYKGDFSLGYRHGQGTYTYPNGDTYTGNWVDGEQSGYGVYTKPDGTIYEGYFEHNKRHGQGTMKWTSSGDSYTGEWAYGKLNGSGTYTWANGDVYVGYWKDNLMHGQGKYTYANGKVVEGTWENDVFIG